MSEDAQNLIVVTHDGKQHADEILAAVFLRLRFEHIRVVRSSDPVDHEAADMLLDCGGIYDPGNGRYDHHGSREGIPQYRERPSGYATAGLVWKQFGVEICLSCLKSFQGGCWENYLLQCSEENLETLARGLAVKLDRDIVQAVDAWDNGVDIVVEGNKPFLPMQWLIPHLEFRVAMDTLERAFLYRMRRLADAFADEWQLLRDFRDNGPTEFYLVGPGLVVVAAEGERIEVIAAKRMAPRLTSLPLIAVISSIRRGSRWAALLTKAVPERIRIPDDIEYTSGRTNLYHDDRYALLDFLRTVYPAID